jgi:hypothetical protein
MNTVSWYLTVACCTTSLVACAQNEARFHLGLYGSSQIVHVAMPTAGSFMGPSSPPGFGWGGGISANFEMTRKVNVAASLAILNEKAKMSGEYNSSGFSGAPPTQFQAEEVYTWLEFSTSLFVRPLQRESYSLLCGVGLSAKNQLKSYWRARPSGTESYGPAFDLSTYTQQWNYALPLQAGAEFRIGARHKIVCLAGFQFGLRGIYKQTESFGVVLFEDGFYKLNSTSIRLVYLVPLDKKRDKKENYTP